MDLLFLPNIICETAMEDKTVIFLNLQKHLLCNYYSKTTTPHFKNEGV